MNKILASINNVIRQLEIISLKQFYFFLCLFFIPISSFGVENDDAALVDESDYTYIKVKVDGLDEIMRKNVLSLIDFKDFNYKTIVNADDIQKTYDESVSRITTYMHSQGFYQAKITSHLKRKYNSWVAKYSITPDSQVIVNRLKVKVIGPGKDYDSVQKFLNDFPIKRGDGLIHPSYEKTKTTLLKLVSANGYLDAKFTEHEIVVNIKQRTANISLVLTTGRRYFFGHISIEENKIDPALINKFIIIKEGEPYSSVKILKQQNALGDSDYYSEIHIDPRRDLMVDNKIPIEITTTLRKPSKYSIGLGFSTDTGINGSLSWSRRRLNYKGHRLYVGATASKIGATAGIRYRIPFRNPRYDEYVITTNFIQQKTDTSESQIAQLGLARSIMRGEWREILSMDLQREIFSVGLQDDSINLLLPSATWSWVVPRGQLYISKGHMLSITTRASSKSVLSTSNFVQADLNTKWIFPVSTRGRLLTRARLGASSVDVVEDLPASFRYFTGGDQSVRGYSFASLGPKNSEGKVIGGKHLIIGSIEYDFRIKGDWSVAAFYDVGNAFNDINEINSEGGLGVGIRWKTIVGQIRVDLATAISEPDNPRRLHISIGPDF